jgi:hypothetical protein
MRNTILFLSMASLAVAQQTVAPTPERAGSDRGETWDGYNIVNSIETGYRFATVGGDVPTYRSAVNYGNGVRLLGSYFTMNSKDGRGRWLDSIVVTTQGLGNDPYESAALRIQKNRTYRYDMSWRRNDYFNPGLVTAGASGNHLLDTEYRMQDHDLTLFPESNLKFFLGYTGTSQTGAAISSAQPLQPGADAVPLFANVRRVRREYRVGNEFRVFGVRVNWMRGWEDFKDDTPATLSSFAPAGAGVDSLQRLEPYHGTSPYWRVALFSDRKIVGVNGRFTYTAGRRAFIVDETAIGAGIGAQQSRQIQTFGDAQRPVATGNLNVVVAPGSKLTIVNSTSVYNVRTSGNSSFTQFDNGTHSFDALYFQYLGIRTFANETDLNYQFSPLFGAFAGYEYSNRRIRSMQDVTFLGTVFPRPGDQTNHLNDGRLGVRLRPAKALTVLLSAEVGRNDRPFTPIAERNYHALNGRVQYRSKDLLLAAGAESDYRFNSVTLSSYSSQSRKYFANGSWNPRPWLAFDGSFSRAHLYTLGGIAYFESSQLVRGQSSLYISNLNTLTAGVRLAAAKRADVYVAYVRTQDEGGGRSNPLGPGIGSPNPIFQAVQTFPMAFQSPLARFSLRITGKLQWNAGYQYYGYTARFYANRNFRANTGYTSVTWSF